ncbi:MAG: response regulator [Nitrospirae bacterium]|nr:response regulator [Nitrospirota bacterium]
MTILIVDDCGTTRKIISHYLRSSGYGTVQAANGLEAVEKVSTGSVDFIITDMNMPQMDGLELVKWVRENVQFGQIPIVMLTTEADESRKMRAISAGVSAFLTKPVTQEKLAEEVKRVCDLYAGRR